MHLLHRRFFNLNLPLDLQFELFDNTVFFSSEIWGIENNNDIEKVHFDFLRKITNTRKSTPAYMGNWGVTRFKLILVRK
jgi:hypothetical protein